MLAHIPHEDVSRDSDEPTNPLFTRIDKTYKNVFPMGSAGISGGVDGSLTNSFLQAVVETVEDDLQGLVIVDFGSGTGCTGLKLALQLKSNLIGYEVYIYN